MDSRKRSENLVERRAKPRMECAFSAVVRGWGKNSKKFQEPATLSNLSARGLYLRMSKSIEPGSPLFVVINLSGSSHSETTGARIAVRGLVVRVQPSPNGQCDLAIEFNRNRFLDKWNSGKS